MGNFIRLTVAVAFTLAAFPHTAGASPRDEILEVLEQVVTPKAGLKVWVNDGRGLPLETGTPIALHFTSKEDTHITAMYLDANGDLILLYPAPGSRALGAVQQLDLDVGEATTPYGQESLFVVASKLPITRQSLGIASQDEYAIVSQDDALAVANRLRELVVQGDASDATGSRVDLHIVPQRSTGQGYTRGGIVQYFTEATRSLRRPKLDLDIKFESGSADLRDEVRGDLDVVGAALTDERLRDKRFALVGHTDHQGDTDFNQTLSETRAQSARRYLIDHYAIEPERIEFKGLGESRPLVEGSNENAMEKNRRVELELVR
jgi:outer membrane protein OmpA-like peptidoglycan-associated protein